MAALIAALPLIVPVATFVIAWIGLRAHPELSDTRLEYDAALIARERRRVRREIVLELEREARLIARLAELDRRAGARLGAGAWLKR